MSWWGDLFPELRDLVRQWLDLTTISRLARASRGEHTACALLYPQPASHFITRWTLLTQAGYADPAVLTREMRVFGRLGLLTVRPHVMKDLYARDWEFVVDASRTVKLTYLGGVTYELMPYNSWSVIYHDLDELVVKEAASFDIIRSVAMCPEPPNPRDPCEYHYD
jgi:hypothetical protein